MSAPPSAPQIVYTNTTTATQRIQSIDGKRLAYPLVLEPGESVTAEQVPTTVQVVGTFTIRLEYDE